MLSPYCSQKSRVICHISGTLLSMYLLASTTVVLAHGGHGNEFKSGAEAQTTDSIQVDADTANRLGIKVEAAKKQRLDIGIKTTGKIDTLPDQKVEVTAPLTSKVVELLVKPGSKVRKGQPVAVVASPELVELRVGSQEKQADAQAALQKAEADLKLAEENLDRQQKISDVEITQSHSQLAIAQAQYNRDLAIINQRGVLKVAQENLKRQQQIASANVAQANTETAVAQEQYDRDKELVEKGALPKRQMLESQAKLERAKAEFAKAKNSPEVVQAESEIKRAEVELPLRELRDSQSRIAEVQTQLKKAESRRDVLEAQAQLRRAQSDFQVAQSRLELSNNIYNTRLQQLGTTANAKGLVTITAPIDGTIADREVDIGQSLQDAGGKLMTIINDNQVFATANIYEQDLNKIKNGQRVRVKVASLPISIFEGKITRIGSVVEGETRVVSVQAEINNTNGQLKPGMFAELEVITDKTQRDILVIPNSAVVDVNSKKTVYIQNGNSFQPVEVTLGAISGDMAEVKSGLFEGDMVVTQRAPQLYAQSLRGGSKKEEEHNHQEEAESHGEETKVKSNNLSVPLWLLGVSVSAVIAAGAFAMGNYWSSRRQGKDLLKVRDGDMDELSYQTEIYLDNHKQRSLLSASVVEKGDKEE
jgi:membrane fusion protein, heavy metal efflux system